MSVPAPRVLLSPDAGPLITLAYADSLDLLLKPGWRVVIADMVLVEVMRSRTPTSERIAAWVSTHKIAVAQTQTLARYEAALARIDSTDQLAPRKSHLGEHAIQEMMSALAFGKITEARPMQVDRAVFLFEDHKIARASFVLPSNCQKVSTRAYLQFLEQKGWLESAAEVERRAVSAGRAFSSLRFSK